MLWWLNGVVLHVSCRYYGDVMQVLWWPNGVVLYVSYWLYGDVIQVRCRWLNGVVLHVSCWLYGNVMQVLWWWLNGVVLHVTCRLYGDVMQVLWWLNGVVLHESYRLYRDGTQVLWWLNGILPHVSCWLYGNVMLRAATQILANRFDEIHDQVFDLRATQQRLKRELAASPDNTAVSDKLAATKAKINSKSKTMASLREDVEGNCVHLPEGSRAYLPSEDDEYT